MDSVVGPHVDRLICYSVDLLFKTFMGVKHHPLLLDALGHHPGVVVVHKSSKIVRCSVDVPGPWNDGGDDRHLGSPLEAPACEEEHVVYNFFGVLVPGKIISATVNNNQVKFGSLEYEVVTMELGGHHSTYAYHLQVCHSTANVPQSWWRHFFPAAYPLVVSFDEGMSNN